MSRPCLILLLMCIEISLFAVSGSNDTLVIPKKQHAKKMFLIEHYNKVNWFTASDHCRYHGMYLASIKNADEQKALDAELFGYKNIDRYWIAGNNLADLKTWTWNSDASPFTYTNWCENEPNNDGGNENCVEIWQKHKETKKFVWNDLHCFKTHYFICSNLP